MLHSVSLCDCDPVYFALRGGDILNTALISQLKFRKRDESETLQCTAHNYEFEKASKVEQAFAEMCKSLVAALQPVTLRLDCDIGHIGHA